MLTVLIIIIMVLLFVPNIYSKTTLSASKKTKVYPLLMIAVAFFSILAFSAIIKYNKDGKLLNISEISFVDYIAKIDNTGTMDVYETIEYNVNGKNGFIREYKYGENIELIDIIVDESERLIKTDRASVGDRGVYTFSESYGGKEQTIKVFFPTNGERKITFHYKVPYFVKEYDDFQMLYWNMYDARNEKDIIPLAMNAKITFPEPIKKNDIKLFGHGNVEGKLDIISENEINIRVDNFYGRTFAETKILFPTKPLKNITPSSESKSYSDELNEEVRLQKLTDKQVRTNKIARFIIFSNLIGFLGSFLISIFLLLKYKRAYKKRNENFALDYYRDVPSDYTPAIANNIYNEFTKSSKNSGKKLTSSLLYLYYKKYIDIQTIDEKIMIKIIKKPLESESDEIIFLYEWLALTSKTNDYFSYKEFLKIEKTSSYQTAKTFLSKYESFLYRVNRSTEKLNYKNKNFKNLEFKSHRFFKVCTLAFFLFFTLLCFIPPFNINSTLALLSSFCFIISILFLLSTIKGYITSNNIFSDDGLTEYSKCTGLKNYLNDFTQIENLNLETSFHLWEQFFIYGVALDISEKALRKFISHIPNIDNATNNSDLTTLLYMNNLVTHYGINSYPTQAYASSISATKPTSSGFSGYSGGSGGGGGGGFSGGGGSGGGGGGSSTF